MRWRFSRTHHNIYKECPKKYWLTFHEQGTGIVPVTMALGLSRGILAHSILAHTLTRVKDTDKLPEPSFLTNLFNEETTAFREEAVSRGLEQTDQGMVLEEANRQACLVESLVRSWVKIRLPYLHQRFTIVKVEDDFDLTLDPDGEIVLMSKADAVIQDRTSKEYSALEFKTTGTDRDEYFEGWRYDVQTLNHLMAIKQEFGKTGSSVMMEFLYCGYKKRDAMSGSTIYYSPLIRGHVKRGNPPIDSDEYAWGSEYARRKGWSPFNVWQEDFEAKPQHMTNAEYWVNHVLDVGTLQESLFTREIYRNEEEMKQWVAGASQQQRRVMQGVQLMKALEGGQNALGFDRDYVMAAFFPANLDSSCRTNKYFRECEFSKICYGLITGDPLQAGFMHRKPHHEAEHNVDD